MKSAPIAQWDAFISHAREDKDIFVRPLAHALTMLGANVWYDEFSLKLGDSLSTSIAKGLAGSRYGIVVLSKSFMTKSWPQHELQGLVAQEIGGRSTILPIWHNLTFEEVLGFSPPLADKLAVTTAGQTADHIALQILSLIRPDIIGQTPYEELQKIASGEAMIELQEEIDRLQSNLEEFQCPHCGASLVECHHVPLDPQERDWGTVRNFQCGFVDLDNHMKRPCPSDPKFPKIEDYDIKSLKIADEPKSEWACYALPNTDMARLLDLGTSYGRSEEEARQKLVVNYTAAAKRHW